MKLSFCIAYLILISCTIYDLRRMEIPIWLLLVCTALTIVRSGYLYLKGSISGIDMIPTMLFDLFPGLCLLGASICRKENLGYGDCWIILLLGLLLHTCYTGMLIFFALFFFTTAGLVGMISGKVKRTTRLPFVPFLLMGLGVVTAFV